MKNLAFISLLTGLTVGCASSEPARLDASFGSSVEQMLVNQTYDPAASQNNESRTVKTMDGQKSVRTLGDYRTADPRTSKTRKITEFDFGD